MATLVFSTIGTILGGPVGGAIGALLGQSIDEQILGPSSRGPKLGDLTVQTSSYGTQIPRIYGRMRVAGSVIWSTDLVQSEQTSGAKGQPGVTYSYAVSFAVALSARRVAAIGRIWADGKLLRGAEGDFKVPTQFRFYDGSEDQLIDPLIGSLEGIDQTPAYRGLALAMFEGLELAEYGNRIPFLTFEIIADEQPPGLGLILDDCSAGAIATESAATVLGYAAYGASMRAAAEPLIETYAIPLFDDGDHIRGPVSASLEEIAESELGHGLDDEREPRITRELEPDSNLPAVLRLGYYDPERDYQAGEARALVGDRSGREGRRELPAVLTADQAKGLAQQLLARNWAQRDRLTINLPARRLALEPGATLRLPLAPTDWSIEKVTIEGYISRVELKPSVELEPALVAADPGTVVQGPDVVASATVVALIDAPNFDNPSAAEPVLYLAASSASPGWAPKAVEIRRGTARSIITSARRKATLGNAVGTLGDSGPYLLDTRSAIDVTLVDGSQWLTSCDDDALADGANLALIGAELIQFGTVEPLTGGTFRLSRLLRGRLGTEHHSASHAPGERFILVQRDALVPVAVPAFAIGATISAEPRSGELVEAVVSAASIRPPSPVAMVAEEDGAGGLSIRWTRRSRMGWGWIDEVDAPLGETREIYRVALSSATGAIERTVDAALLGLEPSDLAPLGAMPWTVSVRQLGEQSASVPAFVQIT